MSELADHDRAGSGSGNRSMRATRILLLLIIALFVTLYTAGVLTGTIAPAQQLTATHVALLVASDAAAALLLRPQALERI